MCQFIKITFLLLLTTVKLQAQPYSLKVASTVMNLWRDTDTATTNHARWSYDQGVYLKGIEAVWKQTGDGKYFKYMKNWMDVFVDNDGNINTYKLDSYNIDNVLCGRILLSLYSVLGDEKYYKAANILRSQLASQPRTKEGGFWHKKIYENQMWLDGLYMGVPFYAEYAKTFHQDTAFNDIANQFIWMENHARDTKTGLLYHGWDESKTQKWSNPTTGTSPEFWARADGWYGVALVDVLEQFPNSNPQKKKLIEILNRYATAIAKVQEPKTGVWFDILDKPTTKGNYLESSASCMFVYTIAKGVRLGYLPKEALAVAQKGYNGIIKNFIETDANGQTNLKGTVTVSGLGGTPYRDGSYDYYMKEKVITNDAKGLGAFLLAATEMELIPTLGLGKGKMILLDHYFNQENKKDITGAMLPFHYTFNDHQNSGFSLLGDLFTFYGANLSITDNAPTATVLKGANVYVIVDPDGLHDNPKPNYLNADDAQAVATWVKNGGVLLMMTNDTSNCDQVHVNILAAKFGIHFNDQSRNMVKGNQFETGAVHIPSNHPIFTNTKKAYLKEISTISVTNPATASITEGNDIIMATAKYGKGTVFAVGDPWIYNEYLDGRKGLPKDFENYQAANDLVKWLLSQVK